MKLKLLAATLAFAASGAHAAIDNSTTGNGELFVVVNTATASFVGDLGIQMNSFDGNTLPQSFNMTGFSQWGAFYSSIGNTLAGAQFAVLATDSTGTSAGSDRMYVTSTVPAEDVAAQSNQLGSAAKAMDTWLGLLNTASDVQGSDMAIVTNGSAWSTSSNTTTYFGTVISDQIVNNLPFSVMADASGTADFYSLVTGGTQFSTTPINTTAQAGIWSFQGESLVYAAPVPEADSYALMLAGLGLVGYVARRRKAAFV